MGKHKFRFEEDSVSKLCKLYYRDLDVTYTKEFEEDMFKLYGVDIKKYAEKLLKFPYKMRLKWTEPIFSLTLVYGYRGKKYMLSFKDANSDVEYNFRLLTNKKQ